MTLRDFHNFVKLETLQVARHSGGALLDIGVGKGGDVHKWIKLGYVTVRGVDVNLESLAEAHRRTRERERTMRHWLDYHFLAAGDGDQPIDRYVEDHLVFDVVTCHFSAHYFFDSWENIRRLMDVVQRRLKPGGAFVITCMHGDELLALPHVYDNGVIRILKRPERDTAVEVMLYDSDYFQGRSIPESLILEHVLLGECDEHGLELVSKRPFPTYLRKYYRKTKAPRLRDMEWETTSLYVAYAFQKSTGSSSRPSPEASFPRACTAPRTRT